MVTCPNCGYENPPGEIWCQNCQSFLEVEEAGAPAAKPPASPTPSGSPASATAGATAGAGAGARTGAGAEPDAGAGTPPDAPRPSAAGGSVPSVQRPSAGATATGGTGPAPATPPPAAGVPPTTAVPPTTPAPTEPVPPASPHWSPVRSGDVTPRHPQRAQPAQGGPRQVPPARRAEGVPPPRPGEVACPNPECGAGNAPGRTFCHRCGTLLAAPTAPPGPGRDGRRQAAPVAGERPVTRRPRPVRRIVLLLFLVLLAAAAWYWRDEIRQFGDAVYQAVTERLRGAGVLQEPTPTEEGSESSSAAVEVTPEPAASALPAPVEAAVLSTEIWTETPVVSQGRAVVQTFD